MAGSLDKYTKPEKSTRVLINLPPFSYFDANYFCYLHGQFSVLGNGTLAPGTPPCSLRTCRGLVTGRSPLIPRSLRALKVPEASFNPPGWY